MGRILAAAAAGASAGGALISLECLTLEWLPSTLSAGERHGPLCFTTTLILVTGALGLGALLGAALGALPLPGRRSAGDATAPPLRSWGGTLLAAGVALSIGALLHREHPPRFPSLQGDGTPRPSVVFISLDTVRADHLSTYGYARETSPELSSFAQHATRYSRAVASSDVTLATHASLFTGLYSRHHGARVDPEQGAWRLGDRFETLAERLRSAGYVCAAVVANIGYLGHRWGFDQGFDHYDDRAAPALAPEEEAHLGVSVLERILRALERAPDPGFKHVAMRRADQINDDVFPLLDVLSRSARPFLLFVNYIDPHWPYDPPPPFDERFPGRLAGDASFPSKFDIRNIRSGIQQLRASERRHAVSMYDGEIAYLDQHLGELFRRLDDLALLDSSLVVVTSDHGEALGEHRHMEHGVSVYEDQVHVPLVIKEPGQREGRVVDTLASSVDVLPTILGALEMHIPEGISGVDLGAVPLPLQRSVIAETHPSPLLYRSHPRYRRISRAIYAGDAKLIRSSKGDLELYDLATDPGEQRNLSATSKELAQRLGAELNAWLAARPAHRGPRPKLPDAQRRLLEALGYLE